MDSRGASTSRTLHDAAQNIPSHAKDKQFRVDSDARCCAVVGHTVWLGHNDGTVTVRKTRTAEIVRHMVASSGARVWSMVPVTTSKGSFVWLGLSNGDIEVHSVVNARCASAAASTSMSSLHSRGDASKCGSASSLVTKLRRHTGGIYTMTEFNGQVFTGSSDFEIIQWNGAEQLFVRQLTGHTNYVRALYVEGPILISASDDTTVRVWSCVSGQQLAVGRFHRSGVSALARVGIHMWSGDDTGKIAVWNLQTLEVADVLVHHLGRISSIKKIGCRVYSGSSDHEIVVWDAFSRSVVTRINDHRGYILAVACPAQLCRYFIWSAAADSTVRCWHHDEYRVMTSDMERFDDVRSYQADFAPFKELNAALMQELQCASGKINMLQREHTATTLHTQSTANEVSLMGTKIGDLQGELAALKEEKAELSKQLAQRETTCEAKERELNDLVQQLKASQQFVVEAKCAQEKLQADLQQANRSLEVVTSDRDVHKKALEEIIAARNSEGGAPRPLIILTPTQAEDELKRMHLELEAAVAKCEALKFDMAQTRFGREKSPRKLAPSPTSKSKPLYSPREILNASATTPREDQSRLLSTWTSASADRYKPKAQPPHMPRIPSFAGRRSNVRRAF